MRRKVIGLALCAMLSALTFLGALLLALSFPAEAQQAKVPRIGYLWSNALPVSFMESFKRGLREHGYIDGQNIVIEHRSAEGKRERIPDLIAELVRLEVDVIVVPGTGTILAVKKATKTIPIVMSPSADAVAAGLVDSLARPGGNITGLTMISPDLTGKRIELLKEALPGVVRVAATYLLASRSTALEPWLKDTEAGARLLGLRFQRLGLERDPATWDRVFQEMAQEPGSALVVIENASLISQRTRIGELVVRHRLPAMFSVKEHVEAGGLLSYGPDLADVQRRAATYVDKILKGVKPADIPVQQPTKFELVINLKTAKQIGLTIPDTVLFRADRVIK